LAALKPPKPPPTITTWGLPAGAGGIASAAPAAAEGDGEPRSSSLDGIVEDVVDSMGSPGGRPSATRHYS
jgi:hypothetical protein